MNILVKIFSWSSGLIELWAENILYMISIF